MFAPSYRTGAGTPSPEGDAAGPVAIPGKSVHAPALPGAFGAAATRLTLRSNETALYWASPMQWLVRHGKLGAPSAGLPMPDCHCPQPVVPAALPKQAASPLRLTKSCMKFPFIPLQIHAATFELLLK